MTTILVLLDSIRAQAQATIATVDALKEALGAPPAGAPAPRPEDLCPDGQADRATCTHPAARRVPAAAMGHPTAYVCKACGGNGE